MPALQTRDAQGEPLAHENWHRPCSLLEYVSAQSCKDRRAPCTAYACDACRRVSWHSEWSTCQAQCRPAAARRHPSQDPRQCCPGRCPARQHSLERARRSGRADHTWHASHCKQGTAHSQRDLCARSGVKRASWTALTRCTASLDRHSFICMCLSRERRMNAATQDSSTAKAHICSTAGQPLKAAAALGGAAHGVSTGQGTAAGSAQGAGTDLQGAGSVQGAVPVADSTQSPQYTTPAPNPTKTALGMTSGTQLSSTGIGASLIITMPAPAHRVKAQAVQVFA